MRNAPLSPNAPAIWDLPGNAVLPLLSETYGGRRLERAPYFPGRVPTQPRVWHYFAWDWLVIRVFQHELVPPAIWQTCTFGGQSAERLGQFADFRDLQNDRRLFLISKKYAATGTLSAAETAELDNLQAAFEATLDVLRPLPEEMLEDLEKLAQELEAEGSSP